jgi:hypothetical protein
VATRGWILLLLLAAVTGGFAGCGGGSTTNVQNPPPPTSSTVAIAFQPAPPTSVFLNGTLPVTAMVSNDPSNAGVDWSVTCQNTGNCGLLSPVHTPSGQAATYTPPSTLAANSQTINIAAFATADHTKNVVAQITITAFASDLKGTYVLQTSNFRITLPARWSGRP